MGLADDSAETSKVGGPEDFFNKKGAWEARLDLIEEQIAWHLQQIDRHRACEADLSRQFGEVCRSDWWRKP